MIFNSGTGTKDDPFLIETVEDLRNIDSQNKEGYFYYKQNKNIKLIEYWEPICNSYYNFETEIYEENPFNGFYDGKYYTIENLSIINVKDNAGLFSRIEGTSEVKACVKNLKILSPTIELIDKNWVQDVGVISGSLINGIFENISIENYLVTLKGDAFVTTLGNFVGGAFQSNFSRCESINFIQSVINVDSEANGAFDSRECIINDCLIQGQIIYDNTNKRVAAFTDGVQCTITNCAAIVSINGRVGTDSNFDFTTDLFGAVDQNNPLASIIVSSYFNSDVLTDYAWQQGVTYKSGKDERSRTVILKGIDGLLYKQIGKLDERKFNLEQNKSVGLVAQPPTGANYDQYWGLMDYPEARTTTHMKSKANYVGWDFENVWTIINGEYPRLRFSPPRKIVKCKRMLLANYRR